MTHIYGPLIITVVFPRVISSSPLFSLAESLSLNICSFRSLGFSSPGSSQASFILILQGLASSLNHIPQRGRVCLFSDRPPVTEDTIGSATAADKRGCQAYLTAHAVSITIKDLGDRVGCMPAPCQQGNLRDSSSSYFREQNS